MKVGDTCFHRGLGADVEIISEYSSHFQVRHGKQVFSCSKIAGVDLMPKAEIIESIDLSEEDEKKTINLNQLNGEAIAKSLSGVGKLSAKKIVERRPDGGYLGVEQLKMLNADVNINWEAVLPHVTF